MYRKVAEETNGLDPQLLQLMKENGFNPLKPKSKPKPKASKETFLSQKYKCVLL